MEQFLALTGRNIKVYLRDRGAVFFSLLSTLIVICLMMFFLGDMNIMAITDFLAQFPGRDAAADKENAELLVLAWTSAGILSINGVTVTLASFSGMIKDRVNGKMSSIYTAPVSRMVIAASYIAAAWISSLIVCLITLALTEVYSVTKGMEPFSVVTHLQIVGLIMVNSFVFATLMYLLTMVAKTEGAWSGLGTVIGTLVGFLGGIYIPIGSLSEVIGGMMKCTPVLYSTAMFRKVMLQDIVQKTFEGTPAEFIPEYNLEMGIDLEVFGHTMTVAEEWILLLGCGIMFLVFGACALKFTKKTDR